MIKFRKWTNSALLKATTEMQRSFVRITESIILVVSIALTTFAGDPIASLQSRFHPNAAGISETKEIPDFQKHISPLLGRMGCNGRACHGSFQGQGGLTLSLFGYDFDADHKALLDQDAGRVDPNEPLKSLVLTKPVDAAMHEGGQRFKKDEWEYWVFRRWIEAGASKSTSSKEGGIQKLVQLQVTPTEIIFAAKSETRSLTAIAVWEDGSKEDVSALCRFSTNDSSIAQVDEKGQITSGETGDTHVVVSYDNAVVPVSVVRPIGKLGQLDIEIANAKTEIDRLVLKKLNSLGIITSSIATDAEFFRRVSLDVSGTLPTSKQVRIFLEDQSLDKRSRMIEKLLASPGYAAWWTTFLCDMTGNNDDQLKNFTPLGQLSSQHWYQWIYRRVASNLPYDKIVEGIVTAVSREPDESYLDYCEQMTKISGDETGKSFADRDSMMYYWARNNQKTSEERAIAFAYTFCGVRIQCAQCHKHPFDQWSKQDFDQFERLFDGVVANQNSYMPGSKEDVDKMLTGLGLSTSMKGNDLRKKLVELVKEGKTIPFPELFVKVNKQPENKGKDKKGKKAASVPKKLPTARLLGAEIVDLSTVVDPREPLMEWLRRKDNPYFAKAIVNRIWAHYFQVGIINPPDDISLANAPSNAALLDYLSNGFIENQYDLKWLHRTILNSDTYQRSWQTNETNVLDRRNFSHALLRRLPAETAYDALRIALSNDADAQLLCDLESDRAMTTPGASARSKNGKSNGVSSYALTVFGRSIRESNCDCDKSSDPSLLQTVFIRNDADVLKAMNDPKHSWLAQVAKANNLMMPGIKEPNDMKKGKPIRTEEDYDKEIRKYKKQLQNLANQEGSDKAIREIQSRLTLAEKRLNELVSSKNNAKTQDAPESAVFSAPEEPKANQSLSAQDLDTLVEEIYLRTLSRRPTTIELEKSRKAISIAELPINGVSDVLWAVINTKEFILNH